MKEQVYKRIDHTLLKPDAVWEQIKEICDEAVDYGTASVCIPPSFVKMAKEYLGTRMKVCTVIGFPNGYSTTDVKVFETKNALENGADEIDMVINLGWLKAREYGKILDEIRQIKDACGTRTLKVIIEACLLTTEEKIKMCQIVTESGADYIKTSTGFSTGGATLEDIRLFSKNVGSRVGIKAAGGISSFEDAERFISMGASRLGTSRVIKSAKEKKQGVKDEQGSANSDSY